MGGNFVVKKGCSTLNQEDLNQGQEWVNGTGKSDVRIVGITKTISALSRWALSFNLLAEIQGNP